MHTNQQFYLWWWKTANNSKVHSVQFSCSVVSDSLWSHGLQHTRPPCPLPTPGVHPNPCPLSLWWHPTISSSVVPFSSCPQSFPASGSFPMNQVFASGGQSIGVSASTPSKEHPGLISPRMDWLDPWQPKGLSKVFSSTTEGGSRAIYSNLQFYIFGRTKEVHELASDEQRLKLQSSSS